MTEQRSSVVSARVTTDEYAALSERAAQRGMNVSEFVRAAALGHLEREEKVKQDLTIVVRRQDGRWRAEISCVSEHLGPEVTFSEVCERLAGRLNQLGLNKEDAVITVTRGPACAVAPSLGQPTRILWNEAS